MKQFIPFVMVLPILFSCGKRDEVAQVSLPPAEQVLRQSAPVLPPLPIPAAPELIVEALPSITPGDTLPTNGSGDKYVVTKGDTLLSIAKKYGINYSDIVKWNKIKNPNYIQAAQTLTLVEPSA